MGRNVFQSEDPAAIIQAIGAVVHKGMKPAEAFQMFNDLKK
jgi:putative autoinducer-2 (AI-2) aldolase